MAGRERLALVSVLVPEYDEGIAFFRDALGCELVEDSDQGGGKRWVVLRPAGGSAAGAGFLLARANGEQQLAAVGNQFGGRVGFFFHTSDFDARVAAMKEFGVTFHEEAPRHEVYGTVIVFSDPWGNRWDLLQPAEATDEAEQDEGGENKASEAS